MYDTMDDVLETKPLAITGELLPVRDQLQAVLDPYPTMGRRIRYEQVKGVHDPRWVDTKLLRY